jgi:2-dehydropantoate 2-reductase
MKIVIIGTGGVGGYFGGCLARAKNDVTFIARGEHLKAIQQKGLKIKSSKGNFSIDPANASEDLSLVKNADLVLVCTKAEHIKGIAQSIAPHLNQSTMVLPLQNGVLAAEELSEYIPAQNIIGGLCRIFSKIESPGTINHMGVEPTLIFGELNHEKSARTELLKSTFDAAGFTNRLSDCIQTEIWKKFLMICSSALLAVCRTNYGEVRSLPETRALLIEVFNEVYLLGKATGIDLPDNIVDKTMKAIDLFPAESTSSLTRDVWEGKPSEIEYQNGTVVKLGLKYNVPTPINRFIFHSILPMELNARAKSNKH